MGRGGTERSVSPVAKFRRVRCRIGSASMRRFVWPVAEWRQAGQSKRRDISNVNPRGWFVALLHLLCMKPLDFLILAIGDGG